MIREEEIKQESKNQLLGLLSKGECFIVGAKWADENLLSPKVL